MNKKVVEIEIPKTVDDQVFKMLLADVTKAIQTARALRKGRITVKVEQGE